MKQPSPGLAFSQHQIALTDVTNVGDVDLTGWPSLFSVGNGILEMNADCFAGTCTFTFETHDHFVDALDIHDRWKTDLDVPFSHPFDIDHKWTEQRNYLE